MKILIVKLSSIGDVVHALPILAPIRQSLPAAEISWVVEKKAAEILRDNEYLDELIEIDTRDLRKKDSIGKFFPKARKQFGPLRNGKFDVAIDLQGLLKSASVAKLARARRRFGFAKKNLREPASRFLLTDKVKIKKKTHIIRKNLRLVSKALNIPVPSIDFSFPIFTREEHRHEGRRNYRSNGWEFCHTESGRRLGDKTLAR